MKPAAGFQVHPGGFRGEFQVFYPQTPQGGLEESDNEYFIVF